MRTRVVWAGLLWLFAAPWAWAGQYVLQAGQTQTVPVAARVINGETRCNLRISVPGQADVERVVQAPFFDTAVAITPQDEEFVTVRWQGQARRINDQVVNGCPTQGEARFKVVSNNALTRAMWAGMQAQLPTAKADCVRNMAQRLGLQPAQIISMGDGANDLAMMAESGVSIAFHAKPAVRAQARHAFNHAGLDGVLALFPPRGMRYVDMH